MFIFFIKMSKISNSVVGVSKLNRGVIRSYAINHFSVSLCVFVLCVCIYLLITQCTLVLLLLLEELKTETVHMCTYVDLEFYKCAI